MTPEPWRPWRPILSGAARSRALAAVRAIARALDRPYHSWPLSRGGDRRGLRSASLASGRAGVALFYGALARARRLPGVADDLDPGGLDGLPDCDGLALRLVNEAIEHAAGAGMNASLFCGLAGVGWVAHHLSRDWDDPDAGPDAMDVAMDDPAADVDEVVVECLVDEGHAAPYDLIDGVVGLGVYALDRLPRPAARRAIDAVLACLEARAVPAAIAPDPRPNPGPGAGAAAAAPSASASATASAPARDRGGRAWASGHAPPAAGRDGATDPLYFNVGLSHGVPGVIAFLARVHRAGLHTERTRRLLEDAVAWLLSCRLPPGRGSVFPDYADADGPGAPARTAWCYGDPGVACALLAAGRALGVPAWERAALEAAHAAAARPRAETQVVDAGLCHGAAGLGLVFQRLHAATGDRACADAARAWFDSCLAMRQVPGDADADADAARAPAGEAAADLAADVAIGGFSTWSMERVATGERVADPCWLTGAAGVGLALLSAATALPPDWHRLLLVDV